MQEIMNPGRSAWNATYRDTPSLPLTEVAGRTCSKLPGETCQVMGFRADRGSELTVIVYGFRADQD